MEDPPEQVDAYITLPFAIFAEKVRLRRQGSHAAQEGQGDTSDERGGDIQDIAEQQEEVRSSTNTSRQAEQQEACPFS